MEFLPWLLFSLVTPLLWAINNVFDRLLITHLVKNEYILTFMSGLFRLPYVLILFALSGWFMPETPWLILAIIAGIFNMLPILYYLKALEQEETTRVILLYDISNPIFVLALGTLIFGEHLGIKDLLGFILLFSAGILSSLHFGETFVVRKGIFWIVLAAAMWAISDVLFYYLLPHFPSEVSLLAWAMLGGFFGTFLFFGSNTFRHRCTRQDFVWPKAAWIFFIISSVLGLVSYWTLLKAFALGKVSLTMVITNIQPLLVFALEVFAFHAQKIFVRMPLLEAPNMRWQSLVPKGVALIVLLSGIWILQNASL